MRWTTGTFTRVIGNRTTRKIQDTRTETGPVSGCWGIAEDHIQPGHWLIHIPTQHSANDQPMSVERCKKLARLLSGITDFSKIRLPSDVKKLPPDVKAKCAIALKAA